MIEEEKISMREKKKRFKPELFSHPDDIILNPGEEIITIKIPVGPEGCYIGNGQFKVSEDRIFKVSGFCWTEDACIWEGTAYFKKGRQRINCY